MSGIDRRKVCDYWGCQVLEPRVHPTVQDGDAAPWRIGKLRGGDVEQADVGGATVRVLSIAQPVMLDITSVMRYITDVIEGFSDKRAAAMFQGRMPKGFPPDIATVARRKLRMLDAAVTLNDLRVPPANRLEALSGNREGQHSIRINDQWRVCFVWQDGAHHVEIVDYHS